MKDIVSKEAGGKRKEEGEDKVRLETAKTSGHLAKLEERKSIRSLTTECTKRRESRTEIEGALASRMVTRKG